MPFDETMNHETAPLISVIVAVLNCKTTLQQCVDSVARQTYPNKELIIIDGGSKDGTVDVLRANQEKIAYWISEPDYGIYSAWNKGLAQARGDWICFIGADDYFWDDTVLERIAVQLEKLPASIRVAYGQITLVSNDMKALRQKGEPWNHVKGLFKQFMCIPHVSTMHRRSLFEQHGNFDESFSIAGDYEFLLRELKTGDAVFFQNIITAGQRLNGISTNPANYLKTLREVRRAQRIHGQLLPGRFLLKEMAKEYFRLLLWKIFGERLAKKLRDLYRRIKGLLPHLTKIR